MFEYLLLAVMSLLWAGSFVVGKLTVASVPPEVVAFLRFAVAGSVLMGLLALREPDSLRLWRKDWPLMLGLGATGIALYNLGFFFGLRYGLASHGAMIIPTLNPLITLFAAVPLLGEGLTRRKLSGAAISLVGQVLIFWTLFQQIAGHADRLLGDLFFVGSAVVWSLYTILGRVASRRFSPLAATAWASAVGAVMLIPFALRGARASAAAGTAAYLGNPLFWANVLYLGLGATVAGFVIWSRGVTRLGASRAAVFINLVPVSALALSAAFLDEPVTWVQVGGVLLVLSGVYLAGSTPRDARPKPAPRSA